MSAEIDMTGNRENMFFVGDLPWHGLGRKLPANVGVAEVLALAGLDWTADRQAVQTVTGTACDNYRALTRSDTGAVLSIVSKQYQPVQADDMVRLGFAAFANDAVFHTAGSLRGGKTGWMLAELPSVEVVSEAHRRFLLMTWGHGGLQAVRVFPTDVRVVCRNTQRAALDGAKSEGITIRHTGDVTAKLKAAEAALSTAYASFRTYDRALETLAAYTISKSETAAVLDTVFPGNEDARSRAAFLAQYGAGQRYNPTIQGSAYALLNGISDYVDHETRSAHARDRVKAFANSTIGIGARTKAKALSALVKVAA